MKYKVIGWTNYDDFDIPSSRGTIGFAEQQAIIDDIRKNKYLFSGWHHQESWDNCVPILNDGKKRCFSQRGWGNVMATAYGYLGDYDYASFTFYQSIKTSALNFPSEEFEVENFVPGIIENEHFDINVSKELFDIAKTENPFYLEDLEELSYIDKNDIITIRCNDESLTFLIADVDRNKKEHDFKKHHLINGKYKIILTYKTMRPVYQRKALMIPSYEVNDLFKECTKNYDFNTLLELFDCYDVEYVTNKSTSKRTMTALKRFILEYFEYSYDSRVFINVLYYINDFEFFKSIAYKAIDYDTNILKCFVCFYLDSNYNIDDEVLKLVNLDKRIRIKEVIFRAIELKPNNKDLRNKYYAADKITNSIGFLLVVGGGNISKLTKDDKMKMDLNECKKLNSWSILDVALLLNYPNELITEDKYNYNILKINKEDNPIIVDGIKKYQKYMNDNFDVDSEFVDVLLCGIDKMCKNMDEIRDGYSESSSYIYTLDLVTRFKYNLKEKAIEKYPRLKRYLDEEYK